MIRTPADADGWIYFIASNRQRAVKIGFARDVESRLITLQTGNPYELVVDYAFRGPASLERKLHDKFAHIRRNGEWFHYNEEMHDFIDALEGLRRDMVTAHALEIGGFESVEAVEAAMDAVRMPTDRILALDGNQDAPR